MTRRRLFSLGRLTVFMHPATLIFAAYMLLTGHGAMMLTGIGSILLHEAAHALAAIALGGGPQEMELTPLGMLLRLEDDERLPPLRRFAVLLAGPAMTLLLCVASVLLTGWGWLPRPVGRMIFAGNAALLLVNLLPSTPLDGGRLLALALSTWLPPVRVRSILRVCGTVTGLALIGLNVYVCVTHGGWNLSLCLIGCFLMYGAAVGSTTAAMSEWRGLVDRRIALEKRGVMPCRWITVDRLCTLRRAVQALHPGAKTMLLVPSGDGYRSVSEDELIGAYLSAPGELCGTLVDGR